MIKNKTVVFSLIIIVLIAGILRTFQLSNFPPSLNWDEVSHGYNAYSILQTGHDEWGIPFPGIFRAYGDFKLPIYIYTLVPLISIFELQDFVVRLPSALAGISIVLGIFFLAKIVTRNFKTINSDLFALMASFLVAFNPWLFFLSRVAVEANLAAALFLWGILSLYWGVEQFKSNSRFAYGLVIGAFLLGLTMFTYNSYRIFTPLMFVGFIYLNWPVWKIKLPSILTKFFPKADLSNPPSCSCHLLAFGIFLIFLCFTLLQMSTPEGLARAGNISLIDQGAINSINQHRIDSNLNPVVTRLIYNKITYLIPRIIFNYISYYNPQFWFFEGGTHYQFGIPNTGLLWNFELVTLVIGLFVLIKHYKSNHFIFLWILFAPIAASITRDNPHALRIITIAPIPSFISALGMAFVFHHFQKQKNLVWNIASILALLISVNFIKYTRNYFFEYPRYFSFAWQYGNQELAQWLSVNQTSFDRIFVTKKLGEPHEFLAFYLKWNPADFQKNKVWEYRDADTPQAWYWVHQYQNYFFYNDWELANVQCPSQQKCLLVSSTQTNKDWHSIHQILNLKNETVYYLSENK